MTDQTLAVHREQDTRWRAALLLDFVARHLRAHGHIPPHPGPKGRCGTASEPTCPVHALVALNGKLTTGGKARGLIAGAELRAAYWLAMTELENAAWPDRAPFQQLQALATGLRKMGDFPNPRYPQIYATFVSMFASELDSYTCWRCAATSHHPEDARNKYCGNCHQFESREETTLP